MNSWHYLVFWFEFLHACLVLMCLLMASTQNDIVLIKMHHFEFFWATSESFKIIHIIFLLLLAYFISLSFSIMIFSNNINTIHKHILCQNCPTCLWLWSIMSLSHIHHHLIKLLLKEVFLLVMFLLFIVVKLTQRWEILFKIIKSWHMLIPTYHSAAATSTNPITSILWHVHYHLGLFQTQIT